jgi:hypothetical protein
MTMDQAAVWLAGTILLMLGFVAVVVGIVVINNILHKYWKPVRIFTPDSWKGFNPPAEYQKKVEAPNVQNNIHRS